MAKNNSANTDLTSNGTATFEFPPSSDIWTVPAEQYFRLTSAGSAIGPTIADYFGANSAMPLVSGGHYEIEAWMYFTKTTAATVTWTLTNTAAPTSMSYHFRMSPVAGIVNASTTVGAATYLEADQYNSTSAAQALLATASMSAATHYAHFKIFLINNTGTNFRFRVTQGSGTITPGIGSFYKCRRLPAASTGTFVA